MKKTVMSMAGKGPRGRGGRTRVNPTYEGIILDLSLRVKMVIHNRERV